MSTTMAGVEVVLLRPSVDLAQYSAEIWRLLCEGDGEFVPPLSARSADLSQMDLSVEPGRPVKFFDFVMSNYVLLGMVGDTIAGFLSFRVRDDNSMLPDHTPCTYAVLTYVSPQFRRRGIASSLNDRLESLPPELTSPWIARRLWSTNSAIVTLLAGRNFEEVLRIANHRGPGIDTVYMAKRS